MVLRFPRNCEQHGVRSPSAAPSASMADDLTNRGPQDRSRISMSEDYEVRYWTKALGVSKEDLQKLVDEHGNSAANIKEVLGK
jgi:hypothetical protein